MAEPKAGSRNAKRRPSDAEPVDPVKEAESDEAVVRCLGLGDDAFDEDEGLSKSVSNLTGPTSSPSGATSGTLSESTVATPGEHVQQRHNAALANFGDMRRRQCAAISDNKFFTTVFMILTFYALFAPDIDQLAGNKDSYHVLSIVNTWVCFMFTIEIIVQCFGKDKYFPNAYFWLDTVAMISLLPETWLMQSLMGSNSGFAAGRSSRLARIVRVASRSSRTTRLNRLTRIARMASLLPKLGATFGSRISQHEVQKLVNKKLNRAFRLLDPSALDGRIPRHKVANFIARTRQEFERPTKPTASVMGGFSIGRTKSASSKSREGDREGTESRASDISLPSHEPSIRQSRPSVQSGNTVANVPSDKTTPTMAHVTSDASMSVVGDKSKQTPVASRKASADDMLEDVDTVDFKEFSDMMTSDPIIGLRLYRSCEMGIRRGNNMRTITRIHSEYIAVRVALAVILLLFIVSLVSPLIEDKELEQGLEHLTATMRLKFPDTPVGSAVQHTVRNQMRVFLDGLRSGSSGAKVFYLDLNKLVYCNSLTYSDGNCSVPSGQTYWGRRDSLEAIDDLILNSDYRGQDFFTKLLPDLSDEDLSDLELDERTHTLALVYDRSKRQQEATMSILTTILVILVILMGIVLLTRDLTYMSRNLLKPLRELADDMESIAQLQLVGAVETDSMMVTNEIKQIRRTFENMKKAIKSWGKYVPWPVVQKLLSANIEAELQVTEVEASMYFSDIAGFTTIVESLPPEKSLLLLNRYFNDMTKVIDEHGGVVIEFIGDAIYCIYGQPLPNTMHPHAAVKAALRMLGSLKKLNLWAASKQLPQVNIRCGVHTGKVLVGNMGFGSRMKYGIVGEDAQLPSRLEELNKTYTTSCLISSSTFSWLQTIQSDAFIARPVDFIRLRHEPHAPPEFIYEVMARGRENHPFWEVAELHTAGMELYRKGEFSQAVTTFEKVKSRMADADDEADGPSVLMLSRCRSLLKAPPPKESWDGVWDR